MTSSSPIEFLTFEEVAEVDKALLSSRDKFLARVALYSLRVLKYISQETGQPINEINDLQIIDWIERDPSVQQAIDTDSSFKSFFTKLVLSSLKPLRQIASEGGVPVEALTIPRVVSWFEAQAKLRLEQQT